MRNKSLMWNRPKMWNKSLMWNRPQMWNRPKEVEQAQRATIPAFWRTSLRSAPRFAGQLLKKGGTHEMWNKSLMWNESLMWNSPKMWNRPKEVEQAQRGGTGPKRWNRPKDQPYLLSSGPCFARTAVLASLGS